jgi:hypothetical protein
MDAAEFARYVALVRECAYHNDCTHRVMQDHAWQVLNWFGCPAEWRWPVWVLAQGECYYGANGWAEDQHDLEHFA